VRDYAAVKGDGRVTLPITKDALKLAGIDDRGLDEQDTQFLRTIIDVYEGGPVGVEAVAATMGEERDTLEDVIEPYLLQNAFVTRTRQGRRATKVAYEHLGLKWKPPQQQANGDGSLFDNANGAEGIGRGEEETREVAKNDRKDDRKPRGTR
jgi:Holliday junction DNA helicase RuvB